MNVWIGYKRFRGKSVSAWFGQKYIFQVYFDVFLLVTDFSIQYLYMGVCSVYSVWTSNLP